MTRTLLPLILSITLLIPTARAANESIPILSVTGSASIEVAPDQLQVTFAVVSESTNVEDAMKDNSKRMRDVLSALTKAGVEEDDLETLGFSIQPKYNYNNRNNNEPPKITGYTVSNTVLATTPNLELAGELIEEGVNAGANRVSSLNFGLQHPQDHRAKAIAQATANARADAEALAAAANLTLTGVLEITLDPQNNSYQPYARNREMAAMSDAAPPINPGEVSLTARVRIVYKVARATAKNRTDEQVQKQLGFSVVPQLYYSSINVFQGSENFNDMHRVVQEYTSRLRDARFAEAAMLCLPDSPGRAALEELALNINETATTDVLKATRIATDSTKHLWQNMYQSALSDDGLPAGTIATQGFQVLSFSESGGQVRFFIGDGRTVDIEVHAAEISAEDRANGINTSRWVDVQEQPERTLVWYVIPPPSGIPGWPK